MAAPAVFGISDRAAWLKERQGYIGGTQGAAIVGMNRYASPMTVFLEKIGEPVEQDATSIFAQMGLALEPLIRQLYEQETGYVVRPSPTLRHPVYEFIGVNPDGLIGDVGGVEFKSLDYSTQLDWGEPGEPQKDERSFIPPPYYIQAQHNMLVTGRKWWDVYGFHRTTGKTKLYRLHHDDELATMLVTRYVDFWTNCVLTKTPPALTGHAVDLDYLKKKYPTDRGGMCIATAAVEKVVERLKDAWKRKKEATAEFDAAKTLIQDYMQDNSVCETMDGPISWRRSKDTIGVKHSEVLKGIMSYASVTVPPDAMELLKAEHDRLVTANTGVTRKGSRRFNLPFDTGDDD